MKTTISTLRIIYLALIFSAGSFLVICTLLLNKATPGIIGDDLISVLLVVPTFIGGLIILIGILMVKRNLSDIDGLSSEEKLIRFKPLLIIRAATMEGSCFLFATLFLIFGYELFLYEAVFALAILIIYFPTNNRISSELNIHIREFNALN